MVTDDSSHRNRQATERAEEDDPRVLYIKDMNPIP